MKKFFLEIFQISQENTCVRDSFLMKSAANCIEKESLTQVLSYEFCEISENFSYRTHLAAASKKS